MTPVPADGSVTGTDLPKPTAKVTATIGGFPATVFYAGAAPGLVAGVLQMNLQIPNNVTSGPAVLVRVTTVIGASSFTDANPVTIAVK